MDIIIAIIIYQLLCHSLGAQNIVPCQDQGVVEFSARYGVAKESIR